MNKNKKYIIVLVVAVAGLSLVALLSLVILRYMRNQDRSFLESLQSTEELLVEPEGYDEISPKDTSSLEETASEVEDALGEVDKALEEMDKALNEMDTQPAL